MTQQYIVNQYVFDSAAKTINMTAEPNLKLEGIQLITNLTTGTLIYQFNNASLGGTVSGSVLTLDYDTTGMSSTDKLQILYNPPVGGFFDRALSLLHQAVEHLRAPSWMTQLPAGNYLRVTLDTGTSSINTVNSITSLANLTNLTNMNTIDSRELIWNLWDTEYNTGIRNKIV